MKPFVQPLARLVVPLVLVVLAPAVRAETLSGSVVGPDGKPVAATVYPAFNGTWSARQKQVETAPDGTFQLDVELDPRWKGLASAPAESKPQGAVVVSAPGFSLGTGFLRVGQPATIKLSAPRNIGGVLRDDKGAPVAGATLRVTSIFQRFGSRRDSDVMFFHPDAKLWPQLTTKSGPSGAWEIRGVPPLASVSVELDDDDYVAARAQFDVEGALSGPGRQNIVARRAGTISGRVLDAKGAPAAGVSILAKPQPQPGEGKTRDFGGVSQTGKDGTFRIARVTPGTYTLLVYNRVPERFGVAPENAPLEKRVAPALENVRVNTGQVAANNKLQLVVPALVTGRVVDASGAPLSEVSVGAYGPGAPRSVGLTPVAQTDKQGRFTVALVPGANAVYAYEENRWSNDSPQEPVAVPLTLSAGTSKALSLQIQRRFADLRGQVTLENGAPAPDVEITVWNTSGTGQSLRSDALGHFELKRLALGSQRLDPSDEWTVVSPKNLVLPAPAPVAIVVRHNLMAKVTLRVVDALGKPVEGVKMRFTMPIERESRGARAILSPVTDADGRYSFDALKMPEALQLTLENASKKGYKWRAGGGAVPEVEADSTAFSLADIVMEGLGATLRGSVVGQDGQPVSGVLVRSSGDNFENMATTDAAGRFQLADQPQSEIELLAAKGRSFARIRAKAESGTEGQNRNDISLILQPGAPVPPQDVARAVALFQEMAPSASGRDLSAAAASLTLHQPATALELSLLAPKARPDAARRRIIETLAPDSSDAALSWAQKEVTRIADDAEFVEAATKLGLLLATRQPATARQLFEAIEARRAGLKDDAALIATAEAAGLAARLQLPIAPRLYDQALAAALRDPSDFKNIIEPLAAGTTELAEAVLEELPPGQESNITLFRRAISQVARYDAAGASRLLEQMRVLVDAVPQRPTENGQYRGRDALEFDWAFAAKDVMRALPRTSVEVATRIARRVQGWHRVSALALAAEFGNKQQRVSMIGEAVAAETRGDWMKTVTLPRLGALAVELDGPTATHLFQEGAEMGENQRRDDSANFSSDWSYYAGFWDPAPARLSLEAEWTRLEQRAEKPEDKTLGFRDYAQASLAMAMSSIDLDRALEWARQMSDKPSPNNSSPRARALEFIGELLLQEPQKRRLLIIASESGFDN